MNITKGQSYKLIETPFGLIVTNPNQVLPNLPLQQLVQADSRDLVEYLWRYLQARESGLDWQEAHKAALADAVILPPGGAKLDVPN